MRKITISLIAIITLFMIGCSTEFMDIEVAADSDPNFKLKDYQSYAWLGSAVIVDDELGMWEPSGLDADAEIQILVGQKLNKSLKEDVKNPDLLLACIAAVDVLEAISVEENPDMVLIDIETIPIGALVIVFIDTESGSPVWIAEATANIKLNPDVKTAKRRLDYAVKEMLKRIPK